MLPHPTFSFTLVISPIHELPFEKKGKKTGPCKLRILQFGSIFNSIPFAIISYCYLIEFANCMLKNILFGIVSSVVEHSPFNGCGRGFDSHTILDYVLGCFWQFYAKFVPVFS